MPILTVHLCTFDHSNCAVVQCFATYSIWEGSGDNFNCLTDAAKVTGLAAGTGHRIAYLLRSLNVPDLSQYLPNQAPSNQRGPISFCASVHFRYCQARQCLI